jgi:hypothetical protein
MALAVCIRLHDGFGISPPDRREALRTVDRLLSEAGVSVEWILCDRDGKTPPDARCTVPPGEGEIVLRLMAAPAHPPGADDVFGYAVIDRSTGRGTLATVYPDRLGDLATAAARAEADLLGRAISHEVGHLLLGTTTHGTEGLMRPRWLATEVRRGFGRDWSFTATEVADIGRNLAPASASHLDAPALPVLRRQR